MKHQIRYGTLLVLASALLTACSQETAPPPQRPAPSVSVVEIKTEPVTLQRELPGRATAFLIAEVRPQVDGIVKERLFEEGSYVEAGQPLYQIDDDVYQANYQVAQANLQNARASLELARSEAKRSSELYRSKAISTQEFDNSQTALQQAEAQAKLAAASLSQAQITLDYSRITAPISGQIGRSSITQGALVTSKQSNALATVQQLDPIYVDISQASSELLRYRRAIANGELQEAGASVQIVLEDGSLYPHLGTVSFSEVTVDPTTGSLNLRVVVPNPDGIILPGMYMKGIINLASQKNGILVPQKSVTRSFDGSTTVKVVTQENTVETRAVTLGQSIGNRWIVKDGLRVGDRVITNGLQKAAAGASVKISEVTSK